jgi:glycosyltransferase involved in cell wall biosynthesis
MVYLMIIHVPIYLDNESCFVTTEWKRSLVLLRHSISSHFGEMVLIAPSLPRASSTQQVLEPISAENDGIQPVPSFDLRCRAKAYWLRERRRWLKDLRPWIARSQMVHAGLDDVYRTIMYDGFREAVRQNRPTVFVQDTDIVGQVRESAAGQPLRDRLRLYAYAAIYRRLAISGVRQASLSLLKGRDLMKLYAPFTRYAKEFHDTFHLSHEIVSGNVIEQRLASLEAGRALRLVYCGRLVPRKGIDHSIQLVAEARVRGTHINLDIIGGGEHEDALRQKVEQLGMRGHIAFLGRMPYGPELLQKLAAYDALLFTPLIEDTPRMIFDGYAAGLPMIGSDIGYNRERSEAEHAVWLLPLDDMAVWTSRLIEFNRDRGRLRRLTEAALRAAHYHTAESWYRRRAEWTFEALERHGRASRRD